MGWTKTSYTLPDTTKTKHKNTSNAKKTVAIISNTVPKQNNDAKMS